MNEKSVDILKTSRRDCKTKTKTIFLSSKEGIYPPTAKALFPNFPFSSLPHSPFPLDPFHSSPSPSLPSLYSPSAAKRPPWNQIGLWGNAVSSPSGVWGEAPHPTSILVYSEREKSFDNNYYMDFCILKFVKLLIKSPPPQIVLDAFVANGR